MHHTGYKTKAVDNSIPPAIYTPDLCGTVQHFSNRHSSFCKRPLIYGAVERVDHTSIKSKNSFQASL